MQVVPTVNIVMSYEPEVMIKFQEMGSLEAFKIYKDQQEAFRLQAQLGLNLIGSTITSRPQTYIFNNAPGSTFISLNHSVGGEGSDSLIEIELMDPQGVFEEAMLDNTVEGILDIRSNPVAGDLLKKKNELVFQESLRTKLKKEEKRLNDIDGSVEKLKKIANQLAAVEDTIGEEESFTNLYQNKGKYGAIEDAEDRDQNADTIDILNKQLAAATTQFQRPIYITYGCGDDLLDWAPVHCYGRIIAVDYAFAGPAPRTLKLKFAGLSMHPNAVQGMGVKPFGSLFTKGLVTKGESYRIFNKDAALAHADKYKQIYKANNQVGGVSPDIDTDAYAEKYIDKYLGQPYRPSFHKVVKDAITQFIKNGTNYENVLVCFPNLDIYLSNYLSDCIGSSNWRIAPKDFDSELVLDIFKGFGEALEGIGMKLCQTVESSLNPGVHSSNGPVGDNTFDSLEECECVEDVGDWFESKNIKAVIECDYVSQTFLEKLASVGKAIQNKIEQFAPDDSAPKMSFLTQVKGETDFELLRVMHRSGFIDTPAVPLLYWGDQVFIENFLEARLLEYSSKQVFEELNKSGKLHDNNATYSMEALTYFAETRIVKNVHPLDVIDGLDVGYMKNVIDLVFPIPWIGPFGPMNSGDTNDALALSDDVNLDNNLLSNLKKNQPLKASRMPVFSFGVKNPNVLAVDIDIDGIYTAAMNSTGAASLPGQAKVAGIVPPDFGGTYTAMFQKMSNLDLADTDKAGVPKGFWKLIEPYYESDIWSPDEAENFDEWNAIFNSLGEENFTDIQNKQFSGDSAKRDFKIFMWKAFSTLFTQPQQDPIPLSTKNMPGSNPSKAFITHSMKVADRITNSAMTGRITTLPLFNLASMRRVMNRACLLYCVEPQFTTDVSKSGSVKKSSTWFSGIYNLFSFKHTISADTVESEFLIVKGAGKGTALLKEDKEAQST